MDRRGFLKLLSTTIFLPFVAAPRRKRKWYAAPDMGTGTIADPYTLSEVLASGNIKPGDTVYLRGGVYSMGDAKLSFAGGDDRASITWKAYEGERPLITHADGKPPGAEFGRYAIIDGLTFGGDKETRADRPIFALSDVTLRGCTFFGYYGGIGEGGHINNQYLGNRFVNCGTAVHYHAMYISNFNANPGEGALIEGNTFIGGEGYHMHLWHGPRYVTIRNNLSAGGSGNHYIVVLNGPGHVCEQNVWWKPNCPGYPINRSDGAGRAYRNNYHGPIATVLLSVK